MCQLSFFHLKDGTLNALLINQLLASNSRISNKDGYGIASKTSVFKSASSFFTDTVADLNILKVIDSKSKDPIIGHVRLATAVNGVKTIDVESAHPFQNDKLILAHNGVLEFKDKKNYEKHKDTTVDSIIFLNELSERYDGSNFVTAFQETMSLFFGTFAFIIYSKLENKYFVVRGKTKKLHCSFIETYINDGAKIIPGIVLNTENVELLESLLRFSISVTLLNPKTSVSYTEAKLIKEETIFELDVKGALLVEIGEIKENSKPVSVHRATNNDYYDNYTNSGKNTAYSTNKENVEKKVTRYTQVIVDIMRKFHMDILEVDQLCVLIYGKPLVSLDYDQINIVKETLLKFSEGNYFPKEKVELWNKLKDFYGESTNIYADNSSLKFPYFMNSKKVLLSILNDGAIR